MCLVGMADNDPEVRLERAKKMTEQAAENGDISEELADKLLDLCEAMYEGIGYPTYEKDGEVKTYSAGSCFTYMNRLRIDCANHGLELLDVTADELNRQFAKLDQDRSNSTSIQSQCAAQHFYRYHDDTPLEPGDVVTYETETQSGGEGRTIDPDEILTTEEIDALRKAVDRTKDPVRNRALFEMLVHTGQRIRALLTLKVSDVKAHERPGYFKLNDEVSGLKRALKRGRRRSLLGSQAYVKQWISRHPLRDDDEHDDPYLFIPKPHRGKADPTTPLTYQGVLDLFKRCAKDAGIDKTVTPHAFRHYWVTHMADESNVSWDEIKAQGGWSEQSRTPELIYRHIDDEKQLRKLESQLGLREDVEKDAQRPWYVPEHCPECGTYIEPHWRTCPACSLDFDPASEELKEQMDEDLWEGKGEANEKTQPGIDALREAIEEDPDAAVQALNDLMDRAEQAGD